MKKAFGAILIAVILIVCVVTPSLACLPVINSIPRH